MNTLVEQTNACSPTTAESNREREDSVSIRRATLADMDEIAHHRVSMLRDVGLIDDSQIAVLYAASKNYLREALPSNEYRGWLAECGDKIVAGGGILVRRRLPGAKNHNGGCEAYILNIYTEPSFRRRGLARRLVAAMLLWCRDEGIKRVSLHASKQGRPVYESLGFLPTNEMRYETE
jgi:GNAT superfamily N-acetyltransferase